MNQVGHVYREDLTRGLVAYSLHHAVFQVQIATQAFQSFESFRYENGSWDDNGSHFSRKNMNIQLSNKAFSYKASRCHPLVPGEFTQFIDVATGSALEAKTFPSNRLKEQVLLAPRRLRKQRHWAQVKKHRGFATSVNMKQNLSC